MAFTCTRTRTCQRVLLTPPGLIPNVEVKDLSWLVEAKSDAALIEVQSASQAMSRLVSTYFRQARNRLGKHKRLDSFLKRYITRIIKIPKNTKITSPTGIAGANTGPKPMPEDHQTA